MYLFENLNIRNKKEEVENSNNINRTAFRLESMTCLLFDTQIAPETVWDFI